MSYKPLIIIYVLLLLSIDEVLIGDIRYNQLMETKTLLRNKVIYKRFGNICSFIITISTLISKIYQMYGDISS